MNFLEYEALKREATEFARGLADEVIAHITRMESTMAEQIDRLNTAVDKELSDDAAQNELIAELRSQLDGAKQAVADAVAGQEGAEQTLNEALDAASAAADKLGSNDPPAEPA